MVEQDSIASECLPTNARKELAEVLRGFVSARKEVGLKLSRYARCRMS